MQPLKELHTRVLLRYLHKARACGGYYSPCYPECSCSYSAEEIKSVLATREHVSNKKEAKLIRQKLASK